MWFSVVRTLNDNEPEYASSQWLRTQEAQPSKCTTYIATAMTRIVVDKSTDNAKLPSICFLPQYQRQKSYFLKARAEKGIAWHIDASGVVWTLIDNGKLANQIARLVAIVKKCPYLYKTIDHIRILGIGLELNCNGGSLQWRLISFERA